MGVQMHRGRQNGGNTPFIAFLSITGAIPVAFPRDWV